MAIAIYMRKVKPAELQALEADIDKLLGSIYVRDPAVFMAFVDKYHLRNSQIFIQVATRIGDEPDKEDTTETAIARIDNA